MAEQQDIWYLYILETEKNRLYTGITTDVERRFQQHQTGKGARFTKVYKPIRIVLTKMVGSRSAASKLEAQIKSMPRQAKLQWIANNHME